MKWYHKSIVIIMLSCITPVVLFQLHLLERLALQDEKIKQMEKKYDRMQEVSKNMEERFFPTVTVTDIIREGSQLKSMLLYDKHYRKEYRGKYGLKDYRY
jgi:hypothetical protein